MQVDDGHQIVQSIPVENGLERVQPWEEQKEEGKNRKERERHVRNA